MPGEARPFIIRLWLGGFLMLAGLPAAAGERSGAPAPEACLESALPNGQIACLVRAARAADDVGPCLLSDQPVVRWQCVAIHAAQAGDAGLCDVIPEAGNGAPGLGRDLCRVHLALTWRAPAHCGGLATAILADSCHYQFVETGGDPALCDRIADPLLKSLCGSDGGDE